MAKITDPEIIRALKDGKIINRSKVYYPIYYNGKGDYLTSEILKTTAVLGISDLEATDWEIIRDEA